MPVEYKRGCLWASTPPLFHNKNNADIRTTTTFTFSMEPSRNREAAIAL